MFGIPKYISAEEYSKQSGLGVEEVKRLCRLGEIACKRTEKGHYKIPLYDEAIPKEQYEKLVEENTQLKMIIKTIMSTASHMIREW